MNNDDAFISCDVQYLVDMIDDTLVEGRQNNVGGWERALWVVVFPCDGRHAPYRQPFSSQ